ncbi:hypothetical protein SAMN05192533_12124 [Mesobacillus persicus]|uniref:Uncharacterized protein n=1 Tax=Mesobacillus persicus TaxID=930146 RepID=A0A1H8JGS6_9BACI|nr:hypothetical protein [Mesobacillus persicus]SEN79821.1 hypothetical protein SAMN05192533_12124 [Mesobacillus persicus]
MVIQSNMTPEAIVDVWSETEAVFIKYNVSLTKQPLNILVESNILPSLLQDLNSVVGSSNTTCIEGG